MDVNYNKIFFFDVETCGLKPNYIISLGYIATLNSKIIKKDLILCNPQYPISPQASKVNGFTDEIVKEYPTFDKQWKKVSEYFDGAILCRHNVLFDISALELEFERYNIKKPSIVYCDTLVNARKLISKSEVPNFKLGTLCDHFNIKLEFAHTADADIYATMKLFNELVRLSDGNLEIGTK